MERSNKLIFWMVILLCLVIIIIGVFKIDSLNKKVEEQGENNTVSSESEVDLEVMSDNYKREVSNIIREYLLKNERAEDDFLNREEQAQQTIDKLIDLTLTKEFKDLHLKLIIALNSIQEGYVAMQIQPTEDVKNKIGQGFFELDQLFVEYPWLNN
ncbi:MAG: hypothetical protein ABIA91_01120 [Patescibacteria group bacterium]